MSKTMEEQISELIRNAQENIKDAYDKGYNNGLNDGNINDGTFAAKVKEAYNNGLNDAEKAIKRVLNEPSRGGLYANELQEIFGTKGTFVIFLKYSISEIIEKIRKYDKHKRKQEEVKKTDDEIHVGDEIRLIDSNHKYIVLGFINNGKLFILSSNGLTGILDLEKACKTGRTYPVTEILEELEK